MDRAPVAKGPASEAEERAGPCRPGTAIAYYRDAGIHSLLHAVANLRQGTLSQLASLGRRAFSARPLP